MFELEEVRGQTAVIKVVGVGGAGCNIINNMIGSDIQGVQFVVVNTDAQCLDNSVAPTKVQIGKSITKGLGAGSKPEVGRQSAVEDRALIAEALEGADMVFVTAGMGGGTGTGAAPVVASVARELGALTVAVVTKPFFYEGRLRIKNAEEGLKELEKNNDTLIVIPNDRIELVVEEQSSILESFAQANNVLKHAVQGISDLILVPGLINLDFADVNTVMENAGMSVMGMGLGRGENAAIDAVEKAIQNPLLENASIEGARGILINVTGGLGLKLNQIKQVTQPVYDIADENAHIILGAVINSDLEDEVRVTVIATGFKPQEVEGAEGRRQTYTGQGAPARSAGPAFASAPAFTQNAKPAGNPFYREARTSSPELGRAETSAPATGSRQAGGEPGARERTEPAEEASQVDMTDWFRPEKVDAPVRQPGYDRRSRSSERILSKKLMELYSEPEAGDAEVEAQEVAAEEVEQVSQEVEPAIEVRQEKAPSGGEQPREGREMVLRHYDEARKRQSAPKGESMPIEDPMDVPTFMRRDGSGQAYLDF